MADDWAISGYNLMVAPAHRLWEQTLAVTKREEFDLAEITPIASEVSALSEVRVAWRMSNQARATDRKDGGKLILIHAATAVIESAIEYLWASHALAVLGNEEQKALAPVGTQRAHSLYSDSIRTATECVQERKVKPAPASAWALRMVDITAAPELTRLSVEAQKLNGLPPAWCMPWR